MDDKEEMVEREQAVYDEYDEKITKFLLRLQELEHEEAMSPPKPNTGDPRSSFAANMAQRQNALDYAESNPHVTQAVLDAFYVDDGLMCADSVDEANKAPKPATGDLQPWRVCATEGAVKRVGCFRAHSFPLVGLRFVTGSHPMQRVY